MDFSTITVGQFDLVSNAISFGVAVMLAATAFFFLQRTQVARPYRTAVTISGIVTLIALYHYWQILGSWNSVFTFTDGTIATTGRAFNDAYRYVDWLLTVPLLLVELILVMRLTRGETIDKSVRLGGAAALMILLGYPGETSTDDATRFIFWAAAMVPFLYIVYELFVGLRESLARQPQGARGLVNAARWLTVGTWAFYPVVFLLPMLGLTGGAAVTAVQVGYTIADITAKAAFGVLIYVIAVRKSQLESETATATEAAITASPAHPEAETGPRPAIA
jgi:bacteriorhodopsin